MCLGIPMKIVEINHSMARCEARGIERDISLLMLLDDPISVGEYVVVHNRYAIQKISAAEALSAWQIYDEMLLLDDQAHHD